MIYFGDGFENVDRGRYLHLWAQFGTSDFPKASEIVFAELNYFDYESNCHIVWRRDGQFYEWTGGHCSCNGYEAFTNDFEDWGPLKVTPEALLMRPHLHPDLRDTMKCFVADE